MNNINTNSNGDRDPLGRFQNGNPGGPGNPHGKQVELFRSAIMAAVTREDFRAIARRLVADAKGGSVRAAQLIFDRTLGRVPDAPDLGDRLAQLEAALGIEA